MRDDDERCAAGRRNDREKRLQRLETASGCPERDGVEVIRSGRGARFVIGVALQDSGGFVYDRQQAPFDGGRVAPAD
jgi:hypothetical protein